MASISVISVTSTTCFIHVSIDASYPYWRVYCRAENTPGVSAFDTAQVPYNGSYSTEIKKLTPKTKYILNLGYSNDGETNLGWVYDEITNPHPNFTTKASASAEQWSWSKSNGTASDAETIAAYDAITNKGRLTSFSYKVWNDLCTKVNETAKAAGVVWATTDSSTGLVLPTYEDALMTASDKEMTAARFNAVRFNIGARSSTGIQPVSRGDIIYGRYFTALTNSLNTWINRLSE